MVIGLVFASTVACGKLETSSTPGAGDLGIGKQHAGDLGSAGDVGGTANADGAGTSSLSADGGMAAESGYQISYSTCPSPATGGSSYTIGLLDSASQPMGPQSIADFPSWNELAPGDVVCIYGKSTPYAERLILTRSGSDDAHRIRIVGVLQNGHEPILSGKSATTAAAFNYGATISAYYANGEVSITGLAYGTSVAYLNVEGLIIQDATTAAVGGSAASPTYSTNTYSDPNINGGAQTPWACGSSGINIIRADHVSIVHNRIKNNDNGMFVNSNNGNTSSNILISYNHIYGNGLYGEQKGAWNPASCSLDAHGVYAEASNLTYLGNRFGAPKQGEPTDLLKDRSSGLVVTFNMFVADGVLEATLGDTLLVGATPQSFGHILDLDESYDSSVGFNTLGAVYDNVSVFGNVLFDDSAGANSNQGTTVPVHFGGDQDNPAVYRHHLHFYNNTVIARRDSASDSTLAWFEMETGTNVEAWNNIFYASAYMTSAPASFSLLDTYCYSKPCGTTSDTTQNWVSPPWGTTGVNGSAMDPSFTDLSKYDAHIATNNPTIVANGQAGDSSYPANATTIPLEYLDFLGSMPRPDSAAKIDIGAYGYRPASDT
jgi:hypothetical protein